MNLPIVYHPNYVVPLPEGHRFPMEKFGLLYELLLKDEITSLESIYTPKIPPKEWLQLVHTPDYVQGY
jgi:acetoin utilization deacetylase AcuC-like enzyme